MILRNVRIWMMLVMISSSLVAQVTITKRVETSKNPTLRVTSNRHAQTEARLKKLLTFSDWFTVTTSRGADYTLSVLKQTSSSISIQIQPRGSSPVVFTQSSKGGSLLYRKTADMVIRKVFSKYKTPGLLASQVAFVGVRGAVKEIYVGFPDALSAAVKLTNNKSVSVEPSWSPNGSKLAYTLYGSKGINVILVDMLRRNHRRISAHKGMNAGFTFSPDGRYGAVILSKDGKVELYRVNLRTYKATRLTNNNFEESSPVFSPDSKQILAVANHRRVANLALFNTATGKIKTLYPSWAECVSPDWSKVSNKICFAKKMGKNYAIAMIDMNKPSAGVKILTKTAGNWEAPSWAPDGRHIICSRQYNGTSNLYMIDSWYGKTTPLATPRSISKSLLPTWSPVY